MNNNWYRQRSLFTQPSRPRPPKKKWRIRYIIGTALKRTCMIIGAFVLFGAFMGILLSALAAREVATPLLPDEMVLYLPIKNIMVEHENQLGPYAFADKGFALRNVIWAIDHAATDERVKGFIMKYEGGALNLAHIEELRSAVKRFRERGKFSYVYGPSYHSLGEYYLASAFEQIWLQPMGVLSIPGINAEIPFARALLDKIGIEPQVFARKEYKNLFESFTDTQMSPQSREVIQRVVDDFSTVMSEAIAKDRELGGHEFKQLVDKGLLTDREALDAGLVDRLDYIDTFNDEIKMLVVGDAATKKKIFAPMGRYLKETAHIRQDTVAVSKKPKVGLVYAVGQITENDYGGGDLAAAGTLVKTIGEAADDKELGVIVLRIDSPGGDPTAAEAIRRAIVKAREKGKKIVVSMGASAASGGYWIAADADRIFALPTTFTGSIGVTGGKFSLRNMWSMIGVNWDGVSWGQNAGLWSFNEPYSPTQAERMNALMDNVYDGFISRVAEGRGMTEQQVDNIAGGRVWTGHSAKNIGLVDELGGLDRALDYAAGLVGATDRKKIHVVVLPRPKSTIEKVVAFLEMQSSMGHFFYSNRALFSRIAVMLDDVTASFELGLVLQK